MFPSKVLAFALHLGVFITLITCVPGTSIAESTRDWRSLRAPDFPAKVKIIIFKGWSITSGVNPNSDFSHTEPHGEYKGKTVVEFYPDFDRLREEKGKDMDAVAEYFSYILGRAEYHEDTTVREIHIFGFKCRTPEGYHNNCMMWLVYYQGPGAGVIGGDAHCGMSWENPRKRYPARGERMFNIGCPQKLVFQ